MNQPELIAVTAVYNEEANVATVIREWLRAFAREGIDARLLALNDGSRDDTLSILHELRSQFPNQLLVIDKPNSGHGRTCRFGYEAALEQNASWILQIDCDGQCDPTFFPVLWAKRQQADCVFGLRVTRDDGIVRNVVSKACSVLTSVVTGENLKDANVPYRLMTRAALENALRSVPKDFEVQNVALTLALKRNRALRWAYVPIRFRARQGGTNTINLPKIARMGFRMLWQINRVKK
jgi:glycosyltransferase involved in cell wall biosynthesis